MPKPSLQRGVYLIADNSVVSVDKLPFIVESAIKGGVALVQVRAKGLDSEPFIELTQALLRITRPAGIPLLVNDNVNVAIATNADGVHIGQGDMPYHQARELLGPTSIIGLSIEHMDQLDEANGFEDLDYIACSPVFSTPTKTDTAPAFGLQGLAEMVQKSRHPVCAIGGLNLQNLHDVGKAGAHLAAVVSAICLAPEPEKATRDLVNAMTAPA